MCDDDQVEYSDDGDYYYEKGDDYDDDCDVYEDYDSCEDANDNHLLMLSMTVSSRAVSRSGLSRLAPSWDLGVD